MWTNIHYHKMFFFNYFFYNFMVLNKKIAVSFVVCTRHHLSYSINRYINLYVDKYKHVWTMFLSLNINTGRVSEMLYPRYFVAIFLSKCQFIWGEDNLFSICQRGGSLPYKGIHVYGRDAKLDWLCQLTLSNACIIMNGSLFLTSD